MQDRIKELQALEEYDVNKHLEVIKNGDFELYENEYELVKGSLGLPPAFMQLGELEQQIVMFYNDPEYIEPNSKKHTKNDSFISFLSCYPNQGIVKKLFHEVMYEDGYDREGNQLYKRVVEPSPEYRIQRLRLKSLSTSIWSKNNLKEVAMRMRDIVENDGYKEDEILERKILDDALFGERDSYTLQNRKMAMEIKGMKKPKSMQSINVFLDGGGQKANRVIIEESGNQAYELLPEDNND
jgi:hypothetical protein